MTDTISNFPLAWPGARRRTKYRRVSSFRSNGRRLTIADGCERLESELSRLGAREAIVSTNVRPSLTGWPRSGAAEPEDTGVAVYFKRNNVPYCLACDRWNKVADNIAAIAAEIAANRGRERWGVVTLEEAFQGFAALPAQKTWWQVLGLHSPDVTPAQLRKWFHELARENHPDRGGDPGKMAEQTAAYEEGLEALQRGAA